MSPRLIRPSAVRERIGLKETALKELRKADPTFPKPVSLGVRAIAFVESEIDAWIVAQIAKRDAKGRR